MEKPASKIESNFVEMMANVCGVKLPDTPDTFPGNFFPIPKKYIVLSTGAENNSQQYDYYGEIVSLIRGYCADNKIFLIQVGDVKDPKIDGVFDFRGKTSLRQMAFVLENALAVVCNDSYITQLSGNKGVPTIVLNSIVPSQAAASYYGTNVKIIEPERKGKWSFATDERPKSINKIKPEVVGEAIIRFLGSKEPILIETVRIGEKFLFKSVDYVPDFVWNTKDVNANIRFDIYDGLDNAKAFLQKNRGHVVINKPLPKEFIKLYGSRIDALSYFVKLDVDIDFVKFLIESGVNYNIIAIDSDDETLNKIRFKLLDIAWVFKQSKPEINKEELRKCKFKTKRLFVGREKQYLSEYHYEKDIPFEKEWIVAGDALDSEKFTRNIESFYFFLDKNSE